MTARPRRQAGSLRRRSRRAGRRRWLGRSAPKRRHVFGGRRARASALRSVGLGGGLFGERARVFEDGDGEAARLGLLAERCGLRRASCGDLGGGGLEVVGDGGVVDGGGELFEQRGEFELGEEGAAGGVVDGLGAHGVERVLDGDAGVDGDELFREQDVVAVVLQRFAIGLLLDLVGAVERGFDGAELLDEFDGALVADAGRAGDVVDGVAAQSHDVDDALGRDAEDVFDAGGIEDEVVLGGVQDGDVLVDELHHVLVGGDDVDVVAERGELAGEGADDVVGLEALVVEDGDAEGFERAADVGLLLDEVGRGLGAVGLVAAVLDGLEGWVLMLNFWTSFICAAISLRWTGAPTS